MNEKENMKLEKCSKPHTALDTQAHTQNHSHSHRFLSFYNSVIFSYPSLEGMELAMKVTKYESDL